MDYAPAVLASKLKIEAAASDETQPGTEDRGSIPGDGSARGDESETRDGPAKAGDRDIDGRERGKTRGEGRNVVAGGNKDGLDKDDARGECSGQSDGPGRVSDESTGDKQAGDASENCRTNRAGSDVKEEPATGPDEELFAPGRLYHLVYKEKESGLQKEGSEAARRVYRLIRGTETARFSRIVLSESMLRDHPSREVYWGLRELLKVLT